MEALMIQNRLYPHEIGVPHQSFCNYYSLAILNFPSVKTMKNAAKNISVQSNLFWDICENLRETETMSEMREIQVISVHINLRCWTQICAEMCV